MGLDGPAREIKVEPVTVPERREAPERPERERETVPAAPEREKEKVS